MRCDTLDVTSSARWYYSVVDTAARSSECGKSCDIELLAGVSLQQSSINAANRYGQPY